MHVFSCSRGKQRGGESKGIFESGPFAGRVPVVDNDKREEIILIVIQLKQLVTCKHDCIF